MNRVEGKDLSEDSRHFYKNYTSRVTDNYSDCLDLCIDDPSSMSLNFWLDMNQCDLNSHTRETCPACYMEAPVCYIGMARYTGKMGKANFEYFKRLMYLTNVLEFKKPLDVFLCIHQLFYLTKVAYSDRHQRDLCPAAN